MPLYVHFSLCPSSCDPHATDGCLHRLGQKTVHQMISVQPHLLSSSADKLLDNATEIQQLLSLNEQQLQNFVVRAPRWVSKYTVVLKTPRMGLISFRKLHGCCKGRARVCVECVIDHVSHQADQV